MWLATRKECRQWLKQCIFRSGGKKQFWKRTNWSAELTHPRYSNERPVLHKTHYIHFNNMQWNESVSLCCNFIPAVYIFSRFWAWSGRSCLIFSVQRDLTLLHFIPYICYNSRSKMVNIESLSKGWYIVVYKSYLLL